MENRNYAAIMLVVMVISVMNCSSNEREKQRSPVPFQKKEQTSGNGKILFEEKCALCHGADGTAGISNAANLRTSRLDTGSTIRIITNGKNAMPAFKEPLGSGEIDQIANYVFTLRQ